MSTPDHSPLVRAHVDRAISHLNRYEFAAAVAVLGMALKMDPQAARARMLRGRALARMGRHVEALADLDEAVKLQPRDVGTLAERGALYIAMGRTNQALADFHSAVMAGGNNAGNYFQRGAALFNLAEWARAAEDFTHVINQMKSPQALLYRGLCSRQLNDAESAIADFTAALELEPKFGDAARERGKLLATLNRNEEAMADAERWVAATRNDSDAYSLRGELHRRLGNDPQCMDDYRTAVRFAPTDPKALNRLAWVLATCPNDLLRHGGEAREHAEKAADLTRRDDPLILDTLAAALAECGEFNQALTVIDEAIAFAPTEFQAELSRHREKYLQQQPIRDRESNSSHSAT